MIVHEMFRVSSRYNSFYFASMLNKTFFKTLKTNYKKSNGERRQIISASNIILHDSKRVIFALHRGEIKKAGESLKVIEKNLKNLEKKFGYTRINEEGAYKAGAEEYVEAKMFFKVLKNSKIDKITEVKLEVDSYLGGICDLTGELVRLAINLASNKKFAEVEKIKIVINNILAELVEFDMTGYTRTKYDQAKMNLRKIEQMDYEIKIRDKN